MRSAMLPPEVLVIPLDSKASERPQQICFRSVTGKMLNCLVHKETCLLLRALRAENRDEGRLSCLSILAGALARGMRVACMVDKVVGNLESEADIACIAAVRCARLCRQPRHDARGFHGIFD